MSAKPPFGPPVADDENVYRAILSLPQWAPAYDGPSSTAFDDDIFSVEIASRMTPEGTASRKRSILKIVEFNCGLARAWGFDTRDERDEIAPANMAHAHVYSPSEGRKGKARKLARACKVVEFDDEETESLIRFPEIICVGGAPASLNPPFGMRGWRTKLLGMV